MSLISEVAVVTVVERMEWRALLANGPLTGMAEIDAPLQNNSMNRMAGFSRRDGRTEGVYGDACAKRASVPCVYMGFNEACGRMPSHHRIAMAIDPALYDTGKNLVAQLRKSGAFKDGNRRGLTSSSLLYSQLKAGADNEAWGQWLNATQAEVGHRVWDLLTPDQELYFGDLFVKDTEYGAGRNRYLDIMILDDNTNLMFKQAFGGSV